VPALFEAIRDRLVELGYKVQSSTDINNETISIHRDEEGLLHTYNWKNNKHNLRNDHEEGDLYELFHTENYKFNEPLMINDYMVKFNKDSITVGCTLVDKETIKKIAEKFFTVTDKPVEDKNLTDNDPF
jgi:hypothetical protein